MTIPRILVIDDQLATDAAMREEFCNDRCLAEISLASTNLDLDKVTKDKIAGAVFCSGQIINNQTRVNSLEKVLRTVEFGWASEESWRWALILLDSRFDSSPSKHDDDKFGLRILEALVNRWPDPTIGEGNCEIPVVMLSVLSKSERGRQAGRAGARDYIEKHTLKQEHLQRLLNKHGLIEDTSGLLIGHSLPLLKTLRLAREVARDCHGNLLILGDTGSGKTLLAEYIHRNSPRSNYDYHYFMVSAGRDPTVLKSDLYGYWHGAFSNADKSESGKAERAHKSTLTIDEIGNLPASGQAELLEYGRLNRDGTRSFDRLGTFPTSLDSRIKQAKGSIIGEYNSSTQRISVDVFLITATNEPIDDPEHCRKIGFREDLFFRLGKEYHEYIKFPNLKSRPDDVLPLFYFFLEKATLKNEGVWPKHIDPEVIERLKAYHWPGNVAELKGAATSVEKASRVWDEVLVSYLPKEISSLRKNETIIGISNGKNQTVDIKSLEEEPTNVETLSEVLRVLRDVKVPKSRESLQGKLSSIQHAYKMLIESMLEIALMETKKITTGELQPTSAVNLLLGDKMTATKAASFLLRLAKCYAFDPPKSSNLWQALEWSKKRRQGKVNTSSD